VSTESNIPDYRSPKGSYSRGHKPMLDAEFRRSARNRQRYWARSMVGWEHFQRARPNAAHAALAALERGGLVHAVITQNVDGLHSRAGAARVLELHGGVARVKCLAPGCGATADRAEFQERLVAANEAWIARAFGDARNAGEIASARREGPGAGAVKQTGREGARATLDGVRRAKGFGGALRADGDVDLSGDGGTAGHGASVPAGGGGTGTGAGLNVLGRVGRRPTAGAGDAEGAGLAKQAAGGGADYASFTVPPCAACGEGALMPDLVFFGGSLDVGVKDAATRLVYEEADAVLVAGSSVEVYSAFRLVRAAAQRGLPVGIVNIGPTRADDLDGISFKVEGRCGDVLSAVARAMGLDP